MRLKELRIKNFANIEDVFINFSKYDGRIIAISGPNGSGKTTLLEAAMPATIFRTLPFYGVRVQKHFSKTHVSEIESVYAVDIDDVERIVHFRIQGKYDETPKCFLTIEGSGLVAGPGVADYDRAIVDILPTEEIVMRSLYAQQGDAIGFLSVDPMAAWQMFSDILGLDEIDTYIEESRTISVGQSGKISELKSIISDKRKHLQRLETGKTDLRSPSLIRDELNQVESRIETMILEGPELHTRGWIGEGDERVVLDEHIQREKNHIANIQQFLNDIWNFYHAEYDDWCAKLNKYIVAKKAHNEWKRRLRGVDLDKEICQICPLTNGVKEASMDHSESEAIFLNSQWALPGEIDTTSLIADLENHWLAIKRYIKEKKDIDCIVTTSSKEMFQKRSEWQAQHNEFLRKKGALLTELNSSKEIEMLQTEIAAFEERLAELLTKGNEAQSLLDICKEEKLARIELVRPYIENVSNQILSEYQNGRFRISIDLTQALKTNKQRERLAFSTSVLDLKTGERRSRVSGGEGSVIAEAIRMALTSLEMRTHRLGHSTAIRDEIAGFIDMNNITAYFDILRNGLRFFDKILFVSHLPHITQRADVVIHMNHGKVTLIED